VAEESWVRRPQQSRSQRTEEKIVEAALSLLEQEKFDEITVAEIARKAGISVGGFYARFPSKESLLHWFDESFVEDFVREGMELFATDRWEGKGICDIIRAYLAMGAARFRKHRGLLAQITLRARGTPDESFRNRIQRVNHELHSRFRGLLLERKGQMGHPDPAFAIDLGLNVVSAALRETMLFADFSRPSFRPVAPDKLVEELTALYCAYLQVPLEGGTGKRGRRSRT